MDWKVIVHSIAVDEYADLCRARPLISKMRSALQRQRKCVQ